MSFKLTGSVGLGGQNQYNDVLAVQQALNQMPADQGGSQVKLIEDGKSGSKTEQAIQTFQLHHFGWSLADGRVDPDGATHSELLYLLAEAAFASMDERDDLFEFPDLTGETPEVEGVETILTGIGGIMVGSPPPPPALHPWNPNFEHRLKNQPAEYGHFVTKMKAKPQELESGVGPVNVDCYAVQILKMPKDSSGKEMTYLDFTNHVRLNINLFVNTMFSKFNLYDPTVDGPYWRNTANLGHLARISIAIPGDSGTVGAVAISGPQWMFKTLTTANDGSHPVSGNRVFGFIQPAVGKESEIWFGTRGIDRVTNLHANIRPPFFPPMPFGFAWQLWRSFRGKVFSWINTNGGSAIKIPLYEKTYDWAEVEKHYVRPLRSP